jgi:hypothetical protein
MAKQKFPYTMYKLTPSMIIKEIVLTGKAMTNGWGGGQYERNGYAADAKGKHHYLRPLFATRELALTAAETALAEQEKRYKKAGENLAKRRANLKKEKEGPTAVPAKPAAKTAVKSTGVKAAKPVKPAVKAAAKAIKSVKLTARSKK